MGTLIATGVSQDSAASQPPARPQLNPAAFDRAADSAGPSGGGPSTGNASAAPGPVDGDFGRRPTGGYPFDGAPYGSVPFESAPYRPAIYDSVQYDPTQSSAAQFDIGRIGAPQSDAAQFNATQLEPANGGHAVFNVPSWSAGGTAPGLPQQAGWAASAPSANRCEIDSLADAWECQLLPAGLLYQSYLAGEKEPRISSATLSEADRGLVWDVTLGGRVGLWRYGTRDPLHPQGIQFDMEGAAMVRLDPEQNTDVEAADFRFGFLVTWRRGPLATKTGYYHISSHLGDEFLLRNPGFQRVNYVRDSAIAGLSYDVTPEVRLYSEIAYAIGHEGGALPLEFQYGAEYSPTTRSWWGGPFAAINGHTREERNWASSVNFVGGWQWRGEQTQHRFRVGVQYYQGPVMQYSFVGQNERLFGGGLWFDY